MKARGDVGLPLLKSSSFDGSRQHNNYFLGNIIITYFTTPKYLGNIVYSQQNI